MFSAFLVSTTFYIFGPISPQVCVNVYGEPDVWNVAKKNDDGTISAVYVVHNMIFKLAPTYELLTILKEIFNQGERDGSQYAVE